VGHSEHDRFRASDGETEFLQMGWRKPLSPLVPFPGGQGELLSAVVWVIILMNVAAVL
jgi:hypothetical protein